MSTTELVKVEPSREEIALIKQTVAAGATDAELKLFLFDCHRRGVHPLDRLLHFTKRGGKYTPVTSIDFMRSQAAMSSEMAGSDDPVFINDDNGKPMSATVTVYRMTQGQRFGYAATARFTEYCPDNAPMWKRMPHTMLGKCAEALALRKAFPQQLAGLYAREELDQAGTDDSNRGYSVSAPPKAIAAPVEQDDRGPADVLPDVTSDDGKLRIAKVEKKPTRNPNISRYTVVLSDGRQVHTIREQVGALAEQLCQDASAIELETKTTQYGEDIVALRRDQNLPEIQLRGDDPHSEPVTAETIPF